MLRFAFACVACLALAACAGVEPHDSGVFFDDFNEPDLAALTGAGWAVREQRGHPGIAGASWGPGSLALIDDVSQPGNRLLRLQARTDGTPGGTSQAQLCHERKYYEGTYAARVRFSDTPSQGRNGDVVVQTFYAVAPLAFDFDPAYSELDWEYLPNGGWGDPRTRLYGVSWQTVRVEPWLAFNQAHEVIRSMDGWHVLLMQVGEGHTRLFVDGELRAVQGGRNYPAQPMAISFSLWFSPGGELPGSHDERVWQQDVDWVFHARDRLLSPSEVQARVADFRRAGIAKVDTVPPANPPLVSPCDF